MASRKSFPDAVAVTVDDGYWDLVTGTSSQGVGCYPNGRPQDIASEVVEATRAAGYQTGVTTTSGMNERHGPGLFRLKRLSADPSLPAPYFCDLLAGLRRS